MGRQQVRQKLEQAGFREVQMLDRRVARTINGTMDGADRMTGHDFMSYASYA